jgi:acyl phosphate:glycerol-3-phosphate acyltransferase
MEGAIAVALGYLIGSAPFAFLLARRRGVDLRRSGSGNVGAANVLRTAGTAYALGAMCLDAAKGALAVAVADRLTTGQAAHVAAGLAAIVGHIYPVWLGFHGGKGVATAAGAFAVLSPAAVLVASGVFVVVVWVTRYISVGSISGAVALAIATLAGNLPAPVALGAAGAALIIVHRHRANLARVMAGTEHRIGQRL